MLGFFPESPKFLLTMNKKERSLEILRSMYAWNSGNRKEDFPVKQLLSENTGRNLSAIKGVSGVFKLLWNQTWPLFVQPHVGNTVKLCYLMFVLFSCGHGAFMWFPDFLTQMQEHVDEAVTLCQVVGNKPIAVPLNKTLFADEEDNLNCALDNSNTLPFKIILMIGIVFVTLSATVSFYIDKVDRKKLLTAWLFTSAIVSVALAYIQNFYLMAVAFMIFLSCGLCGGIISAISVALFPTNYRAMATCLILMFGRIGAVCGSAIVGFMIPIDCDLLFYMYGVVIISCVLVCFMLNTQPKPKPNLNTEIGCTK